MIPCAFLIIQLQLIHFSTSIITNKRSSDILPEKTRLKFKRYYYPFAHKRSSRRHAGYTDTLQALTLERDLRAFVLLVILRYTTVIRVF